MPIPQLVPDFQTWATSGTVATNAAIERVMDNAAYTSAHPDDTFVFAGPPRLPAVGSSVSDANAVYHAFSAIGMLQNITFNQSKPFQPMMAIGSSRSFYLGGKAQGSAQIRPPLHEHRKLDEASLRQYHHGRWRRLRS